MAMAAVFRNPLIAWMVENVCICSLALLRWHCVPFAAPGDIPMLMLLMFLGSLFTVEGGIVVHYILAEFIYTDVPYLNGEKSKPLKISEAVKAWCTCNFPASMVAVCSLPLLVKSDIEIYNEKINPHVDWVMFLCKLIIVRITVDVSFYIAHRLLHTKLMYPLHKKHHQHHECQIFNTNSQFHFLDLIIEGFVPPLIGLEFVLPQLGFFTTYFEQYLIFSYIIWYETGSHCGKELPTVSYFPPISVVTRWLGLEENNIRFHENHHKHHNCNFGITQWIDLLLGSRNVNSDCKTE